MIILFMLGLGVGLFFGIAFTLLYISDKMEARKWKR